MTSSKLGRFKNYHGQQIYDHHTGAAVFSVMSLFSPSQPMAYRHFEMVQNTLEKDNYC